MMGTLFVYYEKMYLELVCLEMCSHVHASTSPDQSVLKILDEKDSILLQKDSQD